MKEIVGAMQAAVITSEANSLPEVFHVSNHFH